jgi:hypothetical protein
MLWMIKYGKDLIFETKSSKDGVTAFKLKLNKKRMDSYSSVAHVLFFDCRRNCKLLREKTEKDSDLGTHLSYFPFLFPFGHSKELDEMGQAFSDGCFPLINYSKGVFGVGETVSLFLSEKTQWGSASSYFNSIASLALMVIFFFF